MSGGNSCSERFTGFSGMCATVSISVTSGVMDVVGGGSMANWRGVSSSSRGLGL